MCTTTSELADSRCAVCTACAMAANGRVTVPSAAAPVGLGVLLGDRRLTVPVVVQATEPGAIRAGGVADGLDGVLGERAGLHDHRAILLRIEVDQVDDGG